MVMNKAFSWLAFFGGTLAGIVICPVILLGLLTTGKFDSFLKDNLYPQPEWPEIRLDQTQSQTISTSTATIVTATSTEAVQIAVPKPLASEEYQQSISSLISLSNSITSINTQLTVALQEMNRKSLAQEYDGFFDIVYGAKKLLAETMRPEAGKLNIAIDDLERANKTVTSDIVKSFTDTFIKNSRTMSASLSTYMDAVDSLLSGAAPSSQQVSDLYAIVTKLTAQSEAFKASADALLVEIQRANNQVR